MSKKNKPMEIPPIDYDTSEEAMRKMHEHMASVPTDCVEEVYSPAADKIIALFNKIFKRKKS